MEQSRDWLLWAILILGSFDALAIVVLTAIWLLRAAWWLGQRCLAQKRTCTPERTTNVIAFAARANRGQSVSPDSLEQESPERLCTTNPIYLARSSVYL